MSISTGASCAAQHVAGVVLAITLGTTIATSQAQPLGAETLEQLFAGSDAHFGMDTRPSRGWRNSEPVAVVPFREGASLRNRIVLVQHLILQDASRMRVGGPVQRNRKRGG